MDVAAQIKLLEYKREYIIDQIKELGGCYAEETVEVLYEKLQEIDEELRRLRRTN